MLLKKTKKNMIIIYSLSRYHIRIFRFLERKLEEKELLQFSRFSDRAHRARIARIAHIACYRVIFIAHARYVRDIRDTCAICAIRQLAEITVYCDLRPVTLGEGGQNFFLTLLPKQTFFGNIEKNSPPPGGAGHLRKGGRLYDLT